MRATLEGMTVCGCVCPRTCVCAGAGEALATIRREVAAMDVRVRVAQTQVTAWQALRSGVGKRGTGGSGEFDSDDEDGGP